MWFKRGCKARGLLISSEEWRGLGDPGVSWGHHTNPLEAGVMELMLEGNETVRVTDLYEVFCTDQTEVSNAN